VDSFSDIPDDEFFSATQLIESSYLFPEEELSLDDIIALTPCLKNPYSLNGSDKIQNIAHSEKFLSDSNYKVYMSNNSIV